MVLHRKQHRSDTLLQDYFPAGLALEIKQAAAIKPQVITIYDTTLLLTAQGQLYSRTVEEDFELIYNGPVQHIIFEYHTQSILCITLNARIINLNDTGELIEILPLENVTSIASGEYLFAITNNGSLFELPAAQTSLLANDVGEEDADIGYTHLNKIKQPVVAVAFDPYVSGEVFGNLFLLTLDMKLLHYNSIEEETTVVPNVTAFASKLVCAAEDITNITSELLVRVDGQIYEYSRDGRIDAFEFVINKTESDAIAVFSQSEDYTYITRNGELFYKSTEGPGPGKSYEKVITGGAVISVAPLSVAIRADGQVLTGIFNDDGELEFTTIPRFNAL